MPSNFITVGQHGQYSTIQEGIDAAEANGIHDIVVEAGTYTETDTLSDQVDGLTIEAAPGGGVTLNGSFIINGASNVTLSGLTFQGDGKNVAVSASDSHYLTITGNTFNGTRQAIVFAGTTRSVISNNLMTNTTMSVIEEKDGSDFDTITNNIIDGDAGDPDSATAGAIWLHGASNGIISHNQISNTSNAGISSPPEYRPTVDETCGKLLWPSAERSAFLWCERARVLVGPGASEAPPIAPGAVRPGSALFRL